METAVIVLIVLAAGGFLGSRIWRSWRASRATDGCASDCGCTPSAKAPRAWDQTGAR